MPEWKLFLYFLAITTFDRFQFTSFRLTPMPDPIPTHIQFEAWASLIITVIGIVYLFFCNGGIQGVNFLNRYFPLSVVVGLKFVSASFALFWLHGRIVEGIESEFQVWSSIALLIIINVVMFIRIGFHFKGIARAELA